MKTILAVIMALCALALPALAHPESGCLPPSEGNGFFTLGNIIMLLSALLIGLASLALYAFLGLPISGLRLILLIVGVACVYYGHTEPLGWPPGFWAFFGALGLGGFAFWSLSRVGFDERSTSLRLSALVASIAWGYIALSYMSPVVGFMAVCALGYCIAATKTIDIIASPFGIGELEYSGSTTIAGFVILMLYMAGRYFNLEVSPFEVGAFYISGLVFSASLLVNTWSGLSRTWGEYLMHEFIFMVVALVSLFYGSRLGSSDLVQLGGTLIAVWLVMKVAQFIAKLSWNNPISSLFMLLLIGVLGVVGSTSLMRNSDILEKYTFLQ